MSTKSVELDEEMADALKVVFAPEKDAEALRRLRTQADAIRREMRQKYGDRDIAAELVRESRNGE